MISRQKLIEGLMECSMVGIGKRNPKGSKEEMLYEDYIKLDTVLELIESQPPADQWIPCSEIKDSLLHRIAEYFKEWDGTEPAPTMQVHIDDLRLIAQMNSELCALREERRKYDNVTEFRGGHTAYCQDCHKVVCRMSRLQKQWDEGVFRLERKE